MYERESHKKQHKVRHPFHLYIREKKCTHTRLNWDETDLTSESILVFSLRKIISSFCLVATFVLCSRWISMRLLLLFVYFIYYFFFAHTHTYITWQGHDMCFRAYILVSIEMRALFVNDDDDFSLLYKILWVKEAVMFESVINFCLFRMLCVGIRRDNFW